MISKEKLCINRKTVPGLSLPDFLRLTHELGIKYVELRNDLDEEVSNKNILDGMSSEDFNELLDKYDIQVVDINSVGNTDSADDEKDNSLFLKEMISLASKIGAKKILFCPVMDKNDSRSDLDKFDEGVKTIKEYSQVLAEHDMSGLFETLGFPESSIRTPFRALDIIKSAKVNNFKVVADLFHWFIGGVTIKDLDDKLDINDVGLIHISTVIADLDKSEMTDQNRVVLTDNKKDKIGAVDMLKWFDQHGYKGLYSFEGFSDELRNWDYDTAKANLTKSIELLEKI